MPNGEAGSNQAGAVVVNYFRGAVVLEGWNCTLIGLRV